MDIQKKDSSRVLEPDLILSDGKILHMSEDEQRRFIVSSMALFVDSFLKEFRGCF